MSFTPRTVAQIQAQIDAYKQAQTDLAGLTSTSKVSDFNLWEFVVALASALNEQAMSTFIDEVETIASQAIPGTAEFIQAEVLKFQYGDAVVVNTDFTVGYTTIDTSKQIISNAAVVVSGAGIINVKVASAGAPLSAPQETALTAYLDSIAAAGQNIQIINVVADTLKLVGTVYYNGQYAAAIQANVITALTTYLSSFTGANFDGLVKLSDIETVILSVPGVVDWLPTDVVCTPIVGSPTSLISASTINARSYQCYAGYIVEAANPNDFATTLTFTVANQ